MEIGIGIRVESGLLAAVIAVTVAVAQAPSAAASSIVISSVQELDSIGVDPNHPLSGDYVLGNDIDASGFNFTPIGSNPFQGGSAFTGIFDGNGHTIDQLTIQAASSDSVGLFGYVIGYSGSPGLVTNVHLTNETVVGNSAVGGLIGYSDTGHISNVSVTGSVTGNNAVGGLIGNGGSFYGNSSLTTSLSEVKVSGSSDVGGLVGGGAFDIQNSYSTGAVAGQSNVGGIAAITNGTVSSSYATGPVTGNSNVGGLVGTSGASVTNSYWDTQTTGQSTSAGGTGLTTAQLQSGTLPAGFDSNVWTASAGHDPTLIANTSPRSFSVASAAALSELAYHSASDIINGKLPAGSSLPTGYSVAMFKGNPLEFGDPNSFHAIIFQGPSGTGLVVAFQGTVPGGLLTSPTVWADLGFSGHGLGLLNTDYQVAKDALVSAQNIAQLNGGEAIHLTGHSLGGGLAQILGSVEGLDTLTFNAPGTKLYLQSQGLIPSGDNTNIINYRMAGDVVSLLPGLNTQIGEVITLPSKVPFPSDMLGWAYNHGSKTVIGAVGMIPVSDIKPGQNGSTDTTPLYLPFGNIDLTVLNAKTAGTLVNGIARYVFPVVAGTEDFLVYETDPNGFEFTIGAGDPNFASVDLPFQLDPYDVQAFDNGAWNDEGSVAPLTTFDFSGGGVSAFRVLGVAPENVPFIAGVTFVADGQFTGTVAAVHTTPVPAALPLFATGLGGLGLLGRRRKKSPAGRAA